MIATLPFSNGGRYLAFELCTRLYLKLYTYCHKLKKVSATEAADIVKYD